ncbi:MAG: chemotaxis protein CheW [Candidatus Omnitrophica bacterium]|nr:chemotaxis protein CheW [Candidatus Omnitrophota bacterium]
MEETGISVNTSDEMFIFRIGKKRWGCGTTFVEQVIKIDNYTPVPFVSPSVMGIVYLTGGVVPILIPHEILGEKSDVTVWNNKEAVVLSFKGARVAVGVDGLEDILKLSGNIENANLNFSSGIVRLANKRIYLLDIPAFFDEIRARIKPAESVEN